MKALKDLLASKKAMMAFIASLVWGIGKFGFDVDTETLLPIVSPLWGYIVAQAGADWGKESKKIEMEASQVVVPETDLASGE